MHRGCLGWASSTATILDCILAFSALVLAFSFSASNFFFIFFLVTLRALGDKIYLSLSIWPTSATDKKMFSFSAKYSANCVYVQSKYLEVYRVSISSLNSLDKACLGFLPLLPWIKNSFPYSLYPAINLLICLILFKCNLILARSLFPFVSINFFITSYFSFSFNESSTFRIYIVLLVFKWCFCIISFKRTMIVTFGTFSHFIT